MDMTPQTWPEWYDGKHINEVLFCQQFLDKYPMKCVRGRLFTVDGLIEDEGQIGNLILEEISGVLTSGLSKGVPWLLPAADYQGAEHAQARDRVKERKARTRRLIQEGAILEKVMPEVRTMEPSALEDYLMQKLPQHD